MANRYSYRPSGYNPTQDQQPPPRADARPFLTGCVVVIVILVVALVAVLMVTNGQKSAHLSGTQTAIALTPTTTLTLDSWSMTGTAVFWLTYTPTPTLDVTYTPTSTGTVTPDIPGTMTALYITLRPHMVEVTAEATHEPMARATARPASNPYNPPIASGGNPAPLDSMRAPIFAKGSITRRIGRFDSDSSPISVVSNVCPASRPASRRMPVPALPQSTGALGAFNPSMPTPCTTRSLALGVSMRTPICANARAVARMSSPSRNPLMCETPSASEANITARCEIDLSPGTRISPRSDSAGELTQVSASALPDIKAPPPDKNREP